MCHNIVNQSLRYYGCVVYFWYFVFRNNVIVNKLCAHMFSFWRWRFLVNLCSGTAGPTGKSMCSFVQWCQTPVLGWTELGGPDFPEPHVVWPLNFVRLIDEKWCFSLVLIHFSVIISDGLTSECAWEIQLQVLPWNFTLFYWSLQWKIPVYKYRQGGNQAFGWLNWIKRLVRCLWAAL